MGPAAAQALAVIDAIGRGDLDALPAEEKP
jgi:hypothetical protein